MPRAVSEKLAALIEAFAQLPGVGPKTAEKYAFYILKAETQEALGLAQAITDVKQSMKVCTSCFALADRDPCSICSDPKRDHSVVCVVEQPKDVISLEKTGACKWLYHVLGGHNAPLEGTDASDLTIDKLVERVRTGEVKEIIMATNPNLEGDGTSLYISSVLKPFGVRTTRLARGLPTGSTIEYASGRILTDAILGRQSLE